MRYNSNARWNQFHYDEPETITQIIKNKRMAGNPLPDNPNQIFALSEDMADGLHKNETALNIKQNTEAAMRAEIATARAGTSAYNTAKSNKKTLTATLRIADSNARAFLKAARAVLTQRYGNHWTQNWEATGWPDRSTAVPSSQPKRMQLCASLKTYFTDNPTHENAPLAVTAANAGTLLTAISNARDACNSGLTLAGQKRADRDAAMENLKARMRGLIHELNQVLDPLDPRWDEFGLDQPGLPDRPDVPENLIITTGAPGVVLADWTDARRANHYRVFIQVVGVDEEFRHLFNCDDSDATIPGLPAGKTVKVCVSAANDAGESQPSEAKEIVVI